MRHFQRDSVLFVKHPHTWKTFRS